MVLAILAETTCPTFSALFRTGLLSCSAMCYRPVLSCLFIRRPAAIACCPVAAGASPSACARGLFSTRDSASRHPSAPWPSGTASGITYLAIPTPGVPARAHRARESFPRSCCPPGVPRDELGRHRQLVRGELHGFPRRCLRHAFHFKQHLTRPHHRDPLLRRALALAHTGFSRLLRDRLVGEEPQPNLSA